MNAGKALVKDGAGIRAVSWSVLGKGVGTGRVVVVNYGNVDGVAVGCSGRQCESSRAVIIASGGYRTLSVGYNCVATSQVVPEG